MNKTAFLLLLAAAFAVNLPAAAQQPQGEETVQLTDLPDWLLEFSNLSQQDKADYIEYFKQAKVDYMRGDWINCESRLTSCELIFKGNPNVWNLRCSALIEQGKTAEAETELTRAQQALPNDAVTLMNVANLHLAKKEYQVCIDHISAILDKIPYSQEELRDTLTYRVFLCYLLQGKMQEAKELTKDVSPMADTPLYYYCQASMAITRKDRTGAMRDIAAANRIFAKTAAAIPYQRALNISGLIELYLPAEH